MRKIFLILVIINIIFVSAIEQTPYTPEIITATGSTIIPVSFFNENDASLYNAVLEKKSPVIRLESSSTYVNKEEFGSLNIIIGENNPEKGIYFDNLLISNKDNLVQKIPIIIGMESKRPDYDVSIKLDPSSDISLIESSQEIVISPTITVYKLNYNVRAPNSVAIKFSIYTIDGELLYDSEEVASVSRQSSFEMFANLGQSHPSEIILYVSATSNPEGIEETLGLDLYQASLPNNLLLSPPLEKIDYSSNIYLGIFIFLLSSIILVSYLWYNRSVNQAKDWKSRLNEIKNVKFGEVTKGLRRLEYQKELIERAYSNHYISKKSFNAAMIEISKLTSKLKKRL